MPDIELIRKHLYQLNVALDNLQKHQYCKIEGLRNNLYMVWILERGISIAIQQLLYIFAHIVSSEFNRQYETYTEVGVLLKANNVISNEEEEMLQNMLRNMIRFRYLLSYEYLSVKQEDLLDIVNNRLGDLATLRNSIIRYCRL